MEKSTRLSDVQNSFVQGEITHFTGNNENALMESDVERISNSINTELIDPVIDFVIACDDVLEQSVNQSLTNSQNALTQADSADRNAGQANSKATDALAEAKRAHTRIDQINFPDIPNLDNHTWNWLQRSFDSVSMQLGSGVYLSDEHYKPTITWTPVRQNYETGRYYLEGRFEARLKMIMSEWINTPNSGGHITYVGDYAIFDGRIYPQGLANTPLKPNIIQINAYTETDTQHVLHASASTSISTSEEIKMTIMVNWATNDFKPASTPIHVDLLMTFTCDSGTDIGYGQIFPPLNTNS